MIQATLTEPATRNVEPSVSGVSWAAVLAGAIASCALTLVLLSLGMGLGLAAMSPWGNSGVSTTTFKIGTGLYFIVMAMISSAIGGYLAGRLRTKWSGVHTDEVYFRDTAHGFLAWALFYWLPLQNRVLAGRHQEFHSPQDRWTATSIRC